MDNPIHNVNKLYQYWNFGGVGNLPSVAKGAHTRLHHAMCYVVHDLTHAVALGLNVHSDEFRANVFDSVAKGLLAHPKEKLDINEIRHTAASFAVYDKLGILPDKREICYIVGSGLQRYKMSSEVLRMIESRSFWRSSMTRRVSNKVVDLINDVVSGHFHPEPKKKYPNVQEMPYY